MTCTHAMYRPGEFCSWCQTVVPQVAAAEALPAIPQAARVGGEPEERPAPVHASIAAPRHESLSASRGQGRSTDSGAVSTQGVGGAATPGTSIAAGGAATREGAELRSDEVVTPPAAPSVAPARTAASAPVAGGDGSLSPSQGEPGPAQQDLFSQPVARITDPSTSHDAARAASRTVTFDSWLVLAAHVRADNGLTGDELAEVTGRAYQSVGPRRKPLTVDGYLAATDERRNRKGVWVATDTGRIAWAHAPSNIRTAVNAMLQAVAA